MGINNIFKNFFHRNIIKAAIDNMECGLLYAEKDGRVILLNRKMEKLSKIFDENKVVDADDFWRKIISFGKTDEARRIDFTSSPAFLLKDESVWSFQRSLLTDENKRCVEIVARNVTELYKTRCELSKDIKDFSVVKGKLSKVLKNISKTGNEEELLSYKIRIHDELGNAILRTRTVLRQKDSQKEADTILEVWNNTIKAFKNNRLEAEKNKEGGLDSIIKQAKTLGIDLCMFGNFPVYSNVALHAVREAMYNSIRHAYANTLTVESYKNESGYYIRIYDDGKADSKVITEGGGLKALRRDIEESGGTLTITAKDGVELSIFLSSEE